MKICTKTHVCPSFGEVPVDSLWDDNSPVVADSPDAFKTVKEED